MQTKTKWVGFSAVALAALLASCSGDDGESENGSGGSSSNTSGSGGSSAGKAGSTGGTSAGKAGSGTGGKVGGGGTGGSNPGTAGFNFGGALNLGGAGFDPDDYACDPVPTPGSACDGDTPCLNGTKACYCANAQWACVDVPGGGGGAGPGGDLECPATKPANGSACDAQGICPYGQNTGCACYGGMWTCI